MNAGSIPAPPTMTPGLLKDKVRVSKSGCWEWLKSTNSAGYGQITINKKYWLAHRYALSCVTEVKPSDVVRHLCHNPKCCNPEHLVVGSHKDNYNDSLDTHTKAAEARRGKWSIQGVVYKTCREAAEATGLSMGGLTKHTKNGVFQVDEYRKSCKIAGWEPKI